MKSEWLRWDLHVHTPESFFHNFRFADASESSIYEGDIFEKYIDVLEDKTEVDCIGVTDYFSIEGYKKIFEARKKGRLQNFKLILPNIEFRLNHILEIGDDKQAKKVNFHVIFSDEIDPQVIEDEFLSSLNFIDNRNSKHSLRRSNLISYGSKIKPLQPEFSGMTDYAAGCNSASVALQDIVDLLRDKHSIFEGKYILVLPSEDLSKMPWGTQGDSIRRQLMDHSDAIFSGNPKDRQFALGQLSDKFKDEFGKYWPVIHGSDAHDFDKIFHPDKDRYCWIKGQPTFDGLKQVIYEPEDRVFIGRDQPQFSQYGFSIDGFCISEADLGENLGFKETNLNLSRGLVAVIGGKGSGKTALLDLIAHSFEDRSWANLKEAERLSSFVARNTKGKSARELSTDIDFADGSRYSKNLRESSVHRATITYLSQGKIDEYSNDSNSLQSTIKSIIFDKIRFVKRELIDKYEELQINMSNIVKNVNLASSELKSIYFEISKFDIDIINNNISDKETSLKAIDLDIQHLLSTSSDNRKRYEEILNLQNDCVSKLHKYRTLRGRMNSLKRGLQDIGRIDEDISALNTNMEELHIEHSIPTLNISQISKSIEDAENRIAELVLSIEANQEDLASEIDSMTSKKSRIEELQEKRSIDLESLQELIGKREKYVNFLKNVGTKRDKQYQNISDLLLSQQLLKKAYADIIESFSERMPEILKDIQFTSKVDIDFDLWSDEISDLFDSRKNVNKTLISDLLSEIERNYESPTVDIIKKGYESIISLSSNLKKGKRIQDIENKLFEPPVGLKTSIKYMGTDMENLSMGQRGTVLLSIYLADGDNTLIIDQPEENLDNKYIYNVLVGAIRKAKTQRQIIIATHNANLVINTDAEQIVIADFADGKISYRCGTIEDPETRNDITLILEGGKEAFQKREVRYSAK